MIKQKLYPKTTRVGKTETNVVITEKLDGSNIGFFKYEGELYIAQRNWIFSLSEIMGVDTIGGLYRGLFGWLVDHGLHLQEQLHEGACIFAEWKGMGQIGYPEDMPRVNQFAKCNVEMVDGVFKLKNLYYDRELFKWSYVDQEQPSYIKSVPLVVKMLSIPSKTELDNLYDYYCETVDRKVEGFIVIVNNSITKYVRYKNGKPSEHKS